MGDLTLFVEPTENSVSVCRIISKNLRDINRAGYRVRVEKVSGKQQKTNLKQIGVTATPCLVLPSGQPIPGIKNITAALRDLIDGQSDGYSDRGGGRQPPRQREVPNDAEGIEDWLRNCAAENLGAADEAVDEDWNPDEALRHHAEARRTKPDAGRRRANQPPLHNPREDRGGDDEQDRPPARAQDEFLGEYNADGDKDTEMLLAQLMI